MSHKLLIVDDEPEILETTQWAFEAAGYEVQGAASAEEALKKLEGFTPHLLLIDYKLPGMSGAELLKIVKQKYPSVSAIMITGLSHQTEEVEKDCREVAAAGFLQKPLELSKVLDVVKETLKTV